MFKVIVNSNKLLIALLSVFTLVTTQSIQCSRQLARSVVADAFFNLFVKSGPISVYEELAEQFDKRPNPNIGKDEINESEHIVRRTSNLLKELIVNKALNEQNYKQNKICQNLTKISYKSLDSLANELNSLLKNGEQRINFLRKLIYLARYEINKLKEVVGDEELFNAKLEGVKRVLVLGFSILQPILESHLKKGKKVWSDYRQLLNLRYMRQYDLSEILTSKEFLTTLAVASNSIVLPTFIDVNNIVKEQDESESKNDEEVQADKDIENHFSNMLELEPNVEKTHQAKLGDNYTWSEYCKNRKRKFLCSCLL